MSDATTTSVLDELVRAHCARERRWWTQDQRGRWVVLEPGPGRLLKNSPRDIRDYADAITAQRGCRFSSLSRARKFARAVGGDVRRWRRQMPRRGPWQQETNPWRHALRTSVPLAWRQVSPSINVLGDLGAHPGEQA